MTTYLVHRDAAEVIRSVRNSRRRINVICNTWREFGGEMSLAGVRPHKSEQNCNEIPNRATNGHVVLL